MAKLTEKEVVEQITNFDIDFFDELEEEKEYKKVKELYDKEKALYDQADREEKPFEEIKKQMLDEAVKIVSKNYYVETHERWNGEYGPDADWDMFDKLYINGHLLLEDADLHDHWREKGEIRFYGDTLKNIIDSSLKLKEELDQYVARYNELLELSEIVEYDNLQKQIDEVSKQKGLKARVKLAQLNSKKKKMLKNPAVKEFDDIIKAFDVDLYNKLSEVIPALQEKYAKYQEASNNIERIREDLYSKFTFRDNDKNWWGWYSEENILTGKLRELKHKIEKTTIPRNRDAKNFKLAKFYREHEAEFANTRKTLLMIYQENTDKEFQVNFKNILAAYDQAVIIAKNEGKDFSKLTDREQFEYFEAAQKVIEANNKFDAYKYGSGKE